MFHNEMICFWKACPLWGVLPCRGMNLDPERAERPLAKTAPERQYQVQSADVLTYK